MILSEKYNAIMERVAVTPGMRTRIMDNLGLPGTVHRPTLPRITGRYRSYAAAAACLLLVIVGAFLVTRLNRPTVDPPPDDTVYTPWGSVTYDSAAELSQAVGFPVTDLSHLPFTPTDTVYQKYPDGMAEITYSDGEKQSVFYRVSKGTGDNSGDYNEYPSVYDTTVGDLTLTLSGDGSLIYKVNYVRDGYACSLTSPQGLTESQWRDIIEA